MSNKSYLFVEPIESQQKMVKILVKGLGRSLTDREVKTIIWLSDCEYETRGILLDLFNELVSMKD